MLSKKKKDQIIDKFRTHKGDTGSPEVQAAILSAEIKELTKHLKTHKKDFSSRRGLLRKVSQRRRLLRYLEREDEKRFDKLVRALKLKIQKKEYTTEMMPDDVRETESEETEEEPKALEEKE